MEDLKLVATLIPCDVLNLAGKAFCREHNQDRYLKPLDIEEGPALSSGGVTPASGELVENPSGKYNSTHRLTLNLEDKVKNPAKGFCFGSNPDLCDILLGQRRQGISNLHFSITFRTFNERKRLILRDESINGTAVAYSGQARNEVRDHFVWILDLEREEGKWELIVLIGLLKFIIELATHTTCEEEYQDEVKAFVHEEPTLGGLAIYSTTEPATPAPGPRLPIYIRERELGRGAFGWVDKITNVSTGEVYARKNFFEPAWERSERRMAKKKEEWLAGIHREIRIMKENQHENIVEVVDYRSESPPYFVMPYFPLGNLDDQECESKISKQEAIDVLYQVLNALQYLHARRTAHRDLKPENILVASRTPLRVKLSDFGLSNDKSVLETVCGTPIYTAPEVYRRSYTTAVDLWSLGVIILQCVYRLPSTDLEIPPNQRVEWGLAWCSRVFEHANKFVSDLLVDLLTDGMLKMIPDERLSADACLVQGHNSGLFGDHAISSGSAKPRPKPTAEGGMNDDTTIILGAHWGIKDKISNRGEESGIGRFSTQLTSKTCESHTHQSTNAPSNRHSRDLQLGGFGTNCAPLDPDHQSPVDFPSSHESVSACTRGPKRLRSPAVGSADNSSGKHQAKRRRREDRPQIENPHPDAKARDRSSQEESVDTMSSGAATLRARKRGLTYPSELLENLNNVSGFSEILDDLNNVSSSSTYPEI